MRKSIVVLGFLLASSLAAQPFSFGSMPADPVATSTITNGAPASYINVGFPARTSGTVSKVSVEWSVACTGAFKVAFLRPSTTFPTSFPVVAQRGPFNSVVGRNDIVLAPPVAVLQGDMLAVVQLQPYATCGSVRNEIVPQGNGGILLTTSDVSTGALGSSSNLATFLIMGAIAYDADPLLVSVLPAAGATQGATAFFRTAVQIRNQASSVITGKLVFHPAGQSAAAGDPFVPFTLNAGQVVSFPDVVTSMGTSGLGSIDVLTDGGAMPIVSARVFSDGGSAGTSGFYESALPPREALRLLQRGILFIPSDLTNFRMNIGVRTLDAGATINFTVYDSAGTFVKLTMVTYPANYFEQKSALQLTGLTTLPANGIFLINVLSGTAFVYGTVTDNRTSDSAMRVATMQ